MKEARVDVTPMAQVKPEASRAHALPHHTRAEAEELRNSKGTASRERGSSGCDSHGTGRPHMIGEHKFDVVRGY